MCGTHTLRTAETASVRHANVYSYIVPLAVALPLLLVAVCV